MPSLTLKTIGVCLLVPFSSMVNGSESALRSDLEEIFNLDTRLFENSGRKNNVFEVNVPDRSRQIALIGVVNIEEAGKNLIDSLLESRGRDLAGPAQQDGFFAEPPTARNLSNLALPCSDFEVLAKCEPNACKVKLDAAGIEKAQSIDWKLEQSAESFEKYLRKNLSAYVQSYRTQGSSALILYDDKPRPFALSKGAEMIHEQMAWLKKREGKLFAYLNSYPENRPENVYDRYYWSLKKLSHEHLFLKLIGYQPRPTLSIDHVVINTSPQTPGVDSILIFKTIYASHYLAARYQMFLFMNNQEVLGVPGHYLILVDRMLFDDKLGKLHRRVLGSGMEDDMRERLEHLAEKSK